MSGFYTRRPRPEPVAMPDAIPSVGDEVRIRTGMYADARGRITRKARSQYPSSVPSADRRAGIDGYRVQVDLGAAGVVWLSAADVEVFDVPYSRRR